MTFFNTHSDSLGIRYEEKKLKVGTYEYFGLTLETTPIRTKFALCYKVESKSKFSRDTSMIFTVFDENLKESNNKLATIELDVAAHNTWQGVVNGNWPNTKNPLKVVGKLSRDSHNSHYLPIEVTELSHLKGNDDYSECIAREESTGQSCKSIFHPNSYKYENKFVS